MFLNPSLRHAFPFRDPKCLALHRAVVDCIYSSAYHFELPPLGQQSWTELAQDGDQRERLEFLGDSHMHGFVARELCTLYPNETPGYYTSARSVLTANSTFAHLLAKIGFHNIRAPVKPAGDLFESLLGKYYAERGEAMFLAYARKFFCPLMEVVGRAYNDYRRSARQCRRQRNHQNNVREYLLTRHHAKDKRRGRFGTPNSIMSPGSARGTPSKAKQRDFIDLTADEDYHSLEKAASTVEPQLSQRINLFPQTPSKSFPSLDALRLETPDVPHFTGDTPDRQSRRILHAITSSPQVQSTPMRRPALILRPSLPDPLPKATSSVDRSSTGNAEPSSQHNMPPKIKGVGTLDDPFIVD